MNTPFALMVFVLQGLVLGADEFIFHRRRALPRWERWGHPFDSVTVLSCFGFAVVFPPTAPWTKIYFGLALLSCVSVTKDEWVHAAECEPMEHWLHALLFLLHPILLFAGYFLWNAGQKTFLSVEATVCLAFLIYQFAYWNFAWPGRRLPE